MKVWYGLCSCALLSKSSLLLSVDVNGYLGSTCENQGSTRRNLDRSHIWYSNHALYCVVIGFLKTVDVNIMYRCLGGLWLSRNEWVIIWSFDMMEMIIYFIKLFTCWTNVHFCTSILFRQRTCQLMVALISVWTPTYMHQDLRTFRTCILVSHLIAIVTTC